MGRPRYVFFDVAGTLLWKPGLADCVWEALARTGIAVDRQEILRRHKLVSEIVTVPDRTSAEFYEEFNATVLRALGVPPTKALLSEIYDCASHLPWEPYPDVWTLEKLSQPIGVIANWDRRLPEQLDLLAVDFFRVIGSQEQGVRKPDEAIYEAAIAGLPCAPEEIVYVGDSIALDIEPAMAVGMDAVLLDRLGLFEAYAGKRVESLADMLGGSATIS